MTKTKPQPAAEPKRMAPPLEWFKGATHRKTDTARHRVWMSKCGRYKVIESTSTFETLRGKPVVRWLAVRHDITTGGEFPVRLTCRSHAEAVAACQDHTEQEGRRADGDDQ